METNQVLETVGGDGPFQCAFIAVNVLFRVTGFWVLFFFSFANYQPPWRCVQWITNASLPLKLQGCRNTTPSPYISAHDSWSCELYSACEDVDFEEGSFTIVTEWGLMCDKAWVLPNMIMVLEVGQCLGSLLGGQLSHSFGIKNVLLSNIGFQATVIFASTFSSGWEVFVAFQFVNGLVSGLVFTICVTYVLEFCSPKCLNLLKMMPTSALGASTSSVIAYLVRDWRLFAYITSGLMAALTVSSLWLPESIRWLYVHGRIDQCEDVARKISKWNGQKECPPIIFDVIKVKTSKKTTFLDLFGNSRQTFITFGISLVWFSTLCVYYLLGLGVKAFAGDFYINLILFCLLEIPAGFLVIPLVKWMGNRACLCILLSMAASGMVSAVSVYYTVPEEESGTVITYLALAAMLCTSGCKQIFVVYTGELFPTVTRSLGVGFASAAGILGIMVSPYLIPTTSDELPVTFSVSAGLLIVTCVCLYFLPETKNKPLQDFHHSNGYTQIK